MAASGTIKGITIQIGADTTKLSSALNSANRSIRTTQSSLTSINKALKFDTTNVKLWQDKQTLLNTKVEETREKLDALKKGLAAMDAQGVDKTSKEYQELATKIDVCESELKGLEKEARSLGSAWSNVTAAMGEKLESVGEKISSIGASLTTKLTVPLVAAGTVAVNKFAEFDKTMQLTNATMANTEEQASLLEDAIKDAAAASTYNMSDAATAALNFARAGLTAEEAASALAPAMNLAAGEGGNLDTVSQGLVATINGFGDSFSETSAYADVFANACNRSALDIDSLSSAMSIAAPIFSAAGYSVNDAALYMGVMADAGIEAGEAANALKTGMARLVAPTKDAQDWLDKLGICITNADGSMKDSVTVQQELHDAFAGLSESEQLAAASAIFGKNQMSNWLALVNTAPSDVESLNSALTESGTTTDMAESMMSGFGGSLEKLKSSIDVAATSFGEALAPAISKVSDAIQSLTDWFNGLSPEQQQMVADIALVVAAIGPLLIVVGKVIAFVGKIMTFAPMISAALAGISAPVGLVVAAVAGAVAAGVLLYKNWDTIKTKATELAGAVKTKFEEIKTGITEAIETAKTSVAEKWESIKETAGQVWGAVKDTVSEKLTNIRTAYDEHGGGLSGAVAASLEAVKSYYTAGFTFIDNLTGGKLSNMLATAKARMSDMASDASTKLESIKGFFTGKLSTVASTVSSKMASVKQSFSSGLNSAYNTVSGILENIKNAFSSKLNAMHDAVSSVISRIKSLFNISLKLDIKLPHISVHGGKAPFGIGGKGSLPSFSVSWYDKGGIFDSPTVIGVGEKRPEFVGALDDLRTIVREESGAVGGGELLEQMHQMVRLMSEMVALESRARSVTVNQTINATQTSYAAQQKAAAKQFKEIARTI